MNMLISMPNNKYPATPIAENIKDKLKNDKKNLNVFDLNFLKNGIKFRMEYLLIIYKEIPKYIIKRTIISIYEIERSSLTNA